MILRNFPSRIFLRTFSPRGGIILYKNIPGFKKHFSKEGGGILRTSPQGGNDSKNMPRKVVELFWEHFAQGGGIMLRTILPRGRSILRTFPSREEIF